MVFAFLWLAYFTQHNTLQVLPCCCKRQDFLLFLQLHSSPLYKCSTAFYGPLGCFQILAIVNNAAMNIGVHKFFRISALGFFGYIPRSGIAWSKGRSIFNFLTCLYTASLSGCTNLHSHQQCTRVPLSPHPCQTCLLIIDGSHSDWCEVISH